MKSLKLIAFYLPQYHPIPENDAWWGAGFTEWRNVVKARSLFPGHRQPRLPGELGFYDLRLSETREHQAELARLAGISGFCYYHYWFGGRLLLEKPLELVASTNSPDFPFCVCWANHHWTNHWAGHSDDILVEQVYPGAEDDWQHYSYLRRFFTDPRYLTRNGRPVFVVFHPCDIPDVSAFVDRFKAWAIRDGLGELWMIGLDHRRELLDQGFDSLAPHTLNLTLSKYLTGWRRAVQVFKHRVLRYPRWVINYSSLDGYFDHDGYDGITLCPTLIPNWDNTPRIGRRGLVLTNTSPSQFASHLQRGIAGLRRVTSTEERFVFIKSWNEWAEGNYLEPDLEWGRGWLRAVRDTIQDTVTSQYT